MVDPVAMADPVAMVDPVAMMNLVQRVNPMLIASRSLIKSLPQSLETYVDSILLVVALTLKPPSLPRGI